MTKPWLVLAILCLILCVCMVIGVLGGTVPLSWSELRQVLWGTEPGRYQTLIVLELRLPRVLLGTLVGFALGVCGAVMQGVFRNPLAEPYLLGIASGATTGAAVVFVLGGEHNIFWLPMGAFAGGVLAMTLVFQMVQHGVRWVSNDSLILAGIAVGAIFSSATSFLMFFSPREQLQQVIFWMMGSLAGAQWSALLLLLVVVVLGSAILFSLARELNAMALGDDMAQHLGIHPVWLKRILLLVTTLLTAAAVAFSGTIGFVGLIVPHAVRLLIGPNHRWLLPFSGVTGAIFLVLCDWASRVVLRPAELPVGLISALLGAPFFLYLLRTYRHGLNRGGNRGGGS